MCDLIEYYKGIPAIFIADSEHENYNFFAHTEEKEMYYLTRVKDINSNSILSGLTLSETFEFNIWEFMALNKKQTNEVKVNK